LDIFHFLLVNLFGCFSNDVPLYNNINKAPYDLIDKNFPENVAVETIYTTPHDVVVTAKNVLSSGKQKFNTTLTTKWSGAAGLEIKKVELKQNADFAVELSYSGFFPGAKLNIDANNGKLQPSAEYRNSNVVVVAKTDSELSHIGFTSVVRYSAFLFGANIIHNLTKSNCNYDFAVAYKANNYFLGLESLKRLSGFKIGGLYNVNKKVVVGTKLEGTTENPAQLVTIGAAYKPDCDATIKAKVSSDLDAATSVQYQCAKGVKFTGSLKAKLNDLSTRTYGVEFSLGN
jgi:hypothetical protein